MTTMTERVRKVLALHSTEEQPLTLSQIKALIDGFNGKTVASGVNTLFQNENFGQIKRRKIGVRQVWGYWFDGARPEPATFLLRTDKGDSIETIPMILFCPNGHRHIDEGEFATHPHHTHACQDCGIVWRPAKVNTHGVQFLPGYKNED